jgi:hypothetical protein
MCLGDRYEGTFHEDLRHGNGTYLFASGSKYVGEFRKGKLKGHGIYNYPDGRVKGKHLNTYLC